MKLSLEAGTNEIQFIILASSTRRLANPGCSHVMETARSGHTLSDS